MNHPPNKIYWTTISSIEDFNKILEDSKTKPALLFKYDSVDHQSNEIKRHLDEEWNIDHDLVKPYLIDRKSNKQLVYAINKEAGVIGDIPQVILFADGVTMYDESGDLINVRKINIALKILRRTFKWMENRY